MAKPTVLVVAGHRSYGDAGNPNEKALTPDMAAAYDKALEAAGYKSTYLQREGDGDTDPDDTVGGLDTVGQKCADFIAKTPGMVVMLDCHYEGASAPGCFGIVPDKKHLGTAINAWQPDDDQWEKNPLDVALARAISKNISDSTELSLRRGIREPGVMSETETGVAQQYNARLAMFAYTAPYRERAVRLVIEHGSLPVAGDKDIIMRPDFTEKCAQATVRAMNAVFGSDSGTVDPPAPQPPDTTTYPAGMDEGIAEMLFGGVANDVGNFFFNPRGPLSKMWLERGKKLNVYPALVDVRKFGDRTYFVFSDGWTVWKKGTGKLAAL